ncbi:hypothetical protein TTHERM_00483550 (macronuclear) [Tetrahymena thermophila SB210]|uniref:Uncharacterized protein n=1 Tax=Tetrahymena thermophila (strain SB210) TaxID=312017 RepID=I7M1N2_TETTS|nr:hypothetical protein TTHERM_00483550 [Tetrahymena thermophila SB210]EAR97223.1 hypothetical protein TTHERM_00483550 [Tetrahymena thermophila SB210]|eukprot:XP_001017468.1 hypothetical protein TTHERM_00483550 [Tetrahymena thermophila SB210]
MSYYTNTMNASTNDCFAAYNQNEYRFNPQYEMNYQQQQNNNLNNTCLQGESFQAQQQQYASTATPYYYQEQQIQYYAQYHEQPEQIYYNYTQQQQPNDQCFNHLYHQSHQQVVYPNPTLEQQNFFKQEAINTKEEFENSCHESDNAENQSITYSPNSPNPLRESNSSLTCSPSSINLKTEEILPLSPKLPQRKNASKKSAANKLAAQVSESSQSLEKTKQSISKNNIRNFLTPIVRMRSGFVDYQLLEKEKLTTLQYDAFLKQHFYVPGQTRLNIRQTIFDSLLDPQEKSQMKEKKVFALTVIKKIQEQFLRLIIEKRSTFNQQEFKQQFEWINGINETLTEFLNSISN